MTATDMDTLWLHDSGEISCAAHGGATMRSAVDARPKAMILRTDLGTWTRVTADDRAEWATYGMGPMSCESCA